METKSYKIVSPQSGIGWTGRKITGSHNGTIDISEGVLTLKDGKLDAGYFKIDTTSIKVLDVADPALNAQFAGHLAADDFFSSEKYPTATFETTSVIPITDNAYHINGNLTIKNITTPLSFDAVVNVDNDHVFATAKAVVDRTKFNMKFRSGNFFTDLGDNLIYDDFDLDIIITAKAA